MSDHENPITVEGGTLRLSGTVNIMIARELHAAARELLEATGDVSVQCGEADHLDGSALQILLALRGDLTAQQRDLKLVDVPDRVRRYIEIAGLEELLPGPSAAPTSAAGKAQ